ncbi:MAG TPA: 3-hydroxyacyl-[acyl-carrier-protein] dehydratase FabZ, partial [Terriglobia bacterium]|nr:3-hydroxyacyl-[acyl-carrier-protein] dehydratase FabZ [Terriglobia bacterium]
VLALRDETIGSDKLVLFASIEEAKFRRPVVPGDQLRLELEVLQRHATFARMKGKAFVDGQVAAQAILICKIAEREK